MQFLNFMNLVILNVLFHLPSNSFIKCYQVHMYESEFKFNNRAHMFQIQASPSWRNLVKSERGLKMKDYKEMNKKYCKSNSIYYMSEHSDLKLWKYMSFEKFMASLTSNTFWFSNIKKFSDPKEGYCHIKKYYDKWIVPKQELGILGDALEVDHYNEHEILVDLTDQKSSRLEKIKRDIERTYISCWNISDYESELMWLAYGKSENSVALVTRYDKLINSLVNSEDQMHFEARRVNYVDIENTKVLLRDSFAPLFMKGRRYKDERELRLSTFNFRLHGDDDNELADYGDSGLSIQVDFKSAIDYVAINPNSSNWFTDMIIRICDKEEIEYKILD